MIINIIMSSTVKFLSLLMLWTTLVNQIKPKKKLGSFFTNPKFGKYFKNNLAERVKATSWRLNTAVEHVKTSQYTSFLSSWQLVIHCILD